MNAREEEICAAALRVVSRYGIKKTTMGDIADEAQISRQTLYNSFSNKHEVVQAVVTYSMAKNLEEIQSAWRDLETLDQKLQTYFEMGPISWYEHLQATPDMADLIEGANAVANSALEAAKIEWVAALCEMMTVHVGSQKAETLADLIYVTSKQMKYTAASRSHLIERLEMLKEMTLATYT